MFFATGSSPDLEQNLLLETGRTAWRDKPLGPTMSEVDARTCVCHVISRGSDVAAFAPALATLSTIRSLSNPPCSLWGSHVLLHARTSSLAQLSSLHTAGFGRDNWATAVVSGHGAGIGSMLELQAIYGSLTQIPLCPPCRYSVLVTPFFFAAPGLR
jgi:hypothetical protein